MDMSPFGSIAAISANKAAILTINAVLRSNDHSVLADGYIHFNRNIFNLQSLSNHTVGTFIKKVWRKT